MPLSKFLNSIGLEQNAQKVYLALLGFGDAPCSRIAKKAEINFMALENPILGILQQFEEIKLTSDVENSAGRPNPFLPY